MAKCVAVGGLNVDKGICDLVAKEIASSTGNEADMFWTALGTVVKDLESKECQLLENRAVLQAQINSGISNKAASRSMPWPTRCSWKRSVIFFRSVRCLRSPRRTLMRISARSSGRSWWSR